MTIEIRRFEPGDEQDVLGVIVPIQRDEFGLAITAEDQPDLKAIPSFYQSGKGDFWVAIHDGTIVGTIGLKDIGSDQAALRKMFVASAFRGREFGVARQLLQHLLDEAAARGWPPFSLAPPTDFWRHIAFTRRTDSKRSQGPICRRAFPS